MRRILSRYRKLFDLVKIGEFGIEASGSLIAILSSFLLYPFISGDTLWKFAVDQSQFIFIASIVTCKSESWYEPASLNPGIILFISLILFPFVCCMDLISWDVYVLGILFALTSHAYVYSIAVSQVYIPFAKGLVMPSALLLTILTDESYLNVNLIVSNLLLLISTYRLNYWKQIRMVKMTELRRIWGMKEFISGGILLHQIDVIFYQYLENLKLSKLEFYLERLVRLLWSILGVRLRTAMLKGKEYSTYIVQIVLVAIALIMTRLNFLVFYLSRYVLQTATYNGGIRKYTLLFNVILTYFLLYISKRYFNLNGLMNVVNISLIISLLSTYRADR